jgi:hypothetical protein
MSIFVTKSLLPEKGYRMAGKQIEEEQECAEDGNDSDENIECDLLAPGNGNSQQGNAE